MVLLKQERDNEEAEEHVEELDEEEEEEDEEACRTSPHERELVFLVFAKSELRKLVTRPPGEIGCFTFLRLL